LLRETKIRRDKKMNVLWKKMSSRKHPKKHRFQGFARGTACKTESTFLSCNYIVINLRYSCRNY
jgi:hypothetical protein